ESLMPINVHKRNRTRELPGWPQGLVLTLALVLAAAGCSKVGQLAAMKNFKAANQAYTQQEYKTAAELYEQTVQADPNLAPAYFYLANSYDNQFKPSKKGEPDN